MSGERMPRQQLSGWGAESFARVKVGRLQKIFKHAANRFRFYYIYGLRSTSKRPDSNGRLDTVATSERFKEAIEPMDKASEAILALKPVTFRYKHELDPDGIPEFGLIAEQVEKVNPDLVARDADGKVYTVRYEAVNAMLLNEFLKEHRKVEKQEATITQLKSTMAQQQNDFQSALTQQQREIKALTASLKEQAAQIQKVSAQLELSRPASQLVRQ
jgi:septal ring factor EnvC (AmiA/AmiB activator)